MRLHRFFIEEYLKNKKEVALYDDELIHQWKDVFRLNAGDKVILLDNTEYEYLSEFKTLAKGKAELKIIESNVSLNIPKKEIWLLASVIKKDNFEWVLEKCTEIGVSHFIPVLSDRTEKKDINLERAHKIVKEASEQSGRGKLPMVYEPMTLKDALEEKQAESFIAFDQTGDFLDTSTRDDIRGSENSLGIIIGPEGGWSSNELKLFESKNIPIYSIGVQVLRAETAAIAVSSLLLL
jgi:16S rRNA (uracil1498-N3)-methyltransferase